MKSWVPSFFLLCKALCQRFVALADRSSAGARLVCADNISIRIFRSSNKIKPVAKKLSSAFGDASTSPSFVWLHFFELGIETSVALLKIKACFVNRVLWLAISSCCNIVTSFWQTVTSVETVSPEFLGVLKPENENLHLSEFSLFLGVRCASFGSAHQISDHIVDLVKSSACNLVQNGSELFWRLFTCETIGDFSPPPPTLQCALR